MSSMPAEHRRLMLDAEYSIEALQTAFLFAAHRQKTAPGLAGFRVMPEHVYAVCGGLLSHDERLAKAQKKWYFTHMVQLYHIYAAAKSQHCMAVMRLLSEFVVTAEGLLDPAMLLRMPNNNSSSSRSSSSSFSSTSTHVSIPDDSSEEEQDGGCTPPTAAALEQREEDILALCLHDSNSVQFLVRTGVVRPAAALAALADNELWETALAVATTAHAAGGMDSLGLGTSDLVDLATDAAMAGDAATAWAFLELGGGLELIISAVEEDQMVCLTANPMRAFSLARSAGYLSHALLIYEDFRLASRLSSEQKFDIMLHAASGRVRGGPAGCTPASLVAAVIGQEQDAGLSLLQRVVYAGQSAVVSCLLTAAEQRCSPRVLRAARMLREVMDMAADA